MSNILVYSTQYIHLPTPAEIEQRDQTFQDILPYKVVEPLMVLGGTALAYRVYDDQWKTKYDMDYSVVKGIYTLRNQSWWRQVDVPDFSFQTRNGHSIHHAMSTAGELFQLIDSGENKELIVSEVPIYEEAGEYL